MQENFGALVGKEVGVSDWMTIDQARIDAFAAVTDDHQFIHVDPSRAAQTQFGGTIAHGFLILSLLAPLVFQATPPTPTGAMTVNYGFEKVRFVAPVPAGANIRARFFLKSCSARSSTQTLLTYLVTVEIQGQEKPALVADWLTLVVEEA